MKLTRSQYKIFLIGALVLITILVILVLMGYFPVSIGVILLPIIYLVVYFVINSIKKNGFKEDE